MSTGLADMPVARCEMLVDAQDRDNGSEYPLMPSFDWLCRYSYDPLDRLARRLPAEPLNEQCFYQKARLTTQIKGQIKQTWLQIPAALLAQHHHQSGKIDCILLATDLSGSVSYSIEASRQHGFTYTPYGYRHCDGDIAYLPGFNREHPDPVTGHYLLGNGYRAFNPLLMRFNSPDSLSPFGKGGINGYVYCAGDPANRMDAQGHAPTFVASVRKLFRRRSPRRPSATALTNDTLTASTSTRPSGAPPVETSRDLLSTPASVRPEARQIDPQRVDRIMRAHDSYLERRAVVPPSLRQRVLHIPVAQQQAWRANQVRQPAHNPQDLPPAYSDPDLPDYADLDLPPPYSERDPG